MRSHYLAALCLLASGACKKKGAMAAGPAPDPLANAGSAAPDRAPDPVPDASDVVLRRAFVHADGAFVISKAALDYVRQDGTLDPTYGHAGFKFGKRPHPPPPPPDDPKRPIGAPVPTPSPVESLLDIRDDCPRVVWEPGKLEDAAGGGSCDMFPVALSPPHCTVREIWKRAIAKGAPAAALAQIELTTRDVMSDEPRPVWQFTIKDAPRNIDISEEFADDCVPVVEQPPR